MAILMGVKYLFAASIYIPLMANNVLLSICFGDMSI